MTDEPTRRRVLATGGAGAALLAVTGCVTVPPATGTGGPAATTGEVPLGPTSEVPVGGGKIYPDRSVVVTQPRAGSFVAFDTTCPHAGCAVTGISDGTVDCPCHGSRFRLSDGTVARGPATRPLSSRPVTVRDGRLWAG